MADYVKHPGVATTTNTGNAYAATLSPAPIAYVNGMGLVLTINADSTATSTINVNGLGTVPIKKANGGAVTNLKAGGVYTLRYSGTSFILQGEGGEYGTAVAIDVRLGKTLGTENGVIDGALNLNNMIPSNIKSGVNIGGVVGTFSSIMPGTTLMYQEQYANSPRESTLTQYTKVRISLGGKYRFGHGVRASTESGRVYTNIYVNGVAKGVARFTDSTSSVIYYTDDIDINPGDVISVGAYIGGSRNAPYAYLESITVQMTALTFTQVI